MDLLVQQFGWESNDSFVLKCQFHFRDEPVNGPLLLRTDFRNTDYII